MTLSQIGGILGLVYCLYRTVFHWNAVVGRYGALSLYWWVLAVTIVGSFLGFAVDLAIWAVQYAAWRASG